MLIEKKINAYIHNVIVRLPLYARNGADQDLRDMIYEMLDDYAGDHEPDILDCRDVLRDLGSPAEMAEAYKQSVKLERERNREQEGVRKLTNEQLLHIMSTVSAVLMVVAVLLIGIGLVAVSVKLTSSMLPLFIGAVLALVSVTGRGFSQRELYSRGM